MKQILLALTFSISLLAFAEDEYVNPVTGARIDSDSGLTVEQMKARDERVLKRTGGFLIKHATGPEALLVDTRAKPRELTFREILRLYKLGTGLVLNYKEDKLGDKNPVAYAREKVADTNVLMVVAVVNAGLHTPALSVYPEERIGIVNADMLAGKSQDPSAPEVRIEKEVWRAIGFIGGLGYSPVQNDIMQPYYTQTELDANIQAYIQPMNMARMQAFWTRFGVSRERRVPYRVAVKQGWAPAPTNDYQRAVWNEEHSIPKNPMKIEYDAKSGK